MSQPSIANYQYRGDRKPQSGSHMPPACPPRAGRIHGEGNGKQTPKHSDVGLPRRAQNIVVGLCEEVHAPRVHGKVHEPLVFQEEAQDCGTPYSASCLPRPSPNPAHPGSPLTHPPCQSEDKVRVLGTHWTVTKGIHGCEGAGLQLERGISGDTQSLLFTIAIGPPGGEGRVRAASSISPFPAQPASPCRSLRASECHPQSATLEDRSWREVPSPQLGYPLHTRLQAPPTHRAGPQQTAKHSMPRYDSKNHSSWGA